MKITWILSNSVSRKILAIRKAIMISIEEDLSNVIIECDSQLAIRTITSAIKVSSVISNIVANIGVLVSVIRNIKFLDNNNSGNRLADSIAKKAYK